MKPYLHMVKRPFWIKKLKTALKERNVVWLKGVRRTGKTTLCRQLEDVAYFDCELPSVRRSIEDPEAFLNEQSTTRRKSDILVLDEVHRLSNPSEVLKIAADYFPNLRIVATGSSTLAAGKKFKDTLTDRKREVWLTPLLWHEWQQQKGITSSDRLLYGGLPPALFSDTDAENFFRDWTDSYWAKDLQELFAVERKASFLKFMELVFVQSGGIFEAKSFAAPCEVSHPTIAHYLRILEETLVALVLRPFHGRKANEIVSAPKVYGFDTGVACYFRGRNELFPSEEGILFEHIVLNELLAVSRKEELHYWRTKQGDEVDFVIARRGKPPIAIEVKKRARDLDVKSLTRFRSLHPGGVNLCVTLENKPTGTTKMPIDVEFVPIDRFLERAGTLLTPEPGKRHR